MKLFKLVLAVAILAAMVLVPSTAQAQALSYETCFQVQNLEASQAAIMISYYSQDGATTEDVNDTVPANGSSTYCPLNAVADGFNGSVVISSDKQIAAIANVTGAGWAKGFEASYAGFSGGALTVNLPLLMAGNYGYNTWYNVQNAGGTATANVDVTYSDGTINSLTVPVNQSVTVDQALDETHTQTVFAATLTSDQPIVVTVMEVGPDMLFGYNGFTASVTNPVLPLVQANNWGFTTGVQIQNTGGASTSVTITYTPAAGSGGVLIGTACTETKTIAAGASETFALNAWAANDTAPSNNCTNDETFVGSAEVTGNTGSVGLVGIVNQHNFGTQKGAAYGSFDPAEGSQTVVLPLIMDRNYGYFTGFNLMNVGSSNATVDCTFTSSTYNMPAVVLEPGEALSHQQLNLLANGYVGSATCSAAESGSQLVVVVNELLNNPTGDTFLVYEGFNK